MNSDSLGQASQEWLKQFLQLGLDQGCPKAQLLNFSKAGVILQHRQLAASAAARLCDKPDGPKEIGYGGARGGGKTHWLLAQMAVDDCQRVPGLKCLLLRKVGKSNLENMEDLRQRVLAGVSHEFNASRGRLTFPNGTRIVLGHYQLWLYPSHRRAPGLPGLPRQPLRPGRTRRALLDSRTSCPSHQNHARAAPPFCQRRPRSGSPPGSLPESVHGQPAALVLAREADAGSLRRRRGYVQQRKQRGLHRQTIP